MDQAPAARRRPHGFADRSAEQNTSHCSGVARSTFSIATVRAASIDSSMILPMLRPVSTSDIENSAGGYGSLQFRGPLANLLLKDPLFVIRFRHRFPYRESGS
ncbi:hypothetical protein QZM64_24685 [Burkholderia cepacia]|uniref:hypothetical protein n=1 Tax=Burkholderia cepacia TaxID=292 RepID=UPI000F5AE7E9|nr:hypothetical protein [Burkholderia cepacia]MCA8030813.1 hypothetical protein [Burkholderia cepacia]MDN7442361.1 hypothetical protein [Burkholderia cepacia]